MSNNSETKKIIRIVYQNNGNIRYLDKVTKITIPHITKNVIIDILRKYKLNVKTLSLDSSIPSIQYINLIIGNDQKIRNTKIEYLGTITIKDNIFVKFKIYSSKDNSIVYIVDIHKEYVKYIINLIKDQIEIEIEGDKRKAIILDSKIIKEYDSKYIDIAPSLNINDIIELLKRFNLSFRESKDKDNNIIYKVEKLKDKNYVLFINYPLYKDNNILYEYRRIIIKRYRKIGMTIKFICMYEKEMYTFRLDLIGTTLTDIKDKVIN